MSESKLTPMLKQYFEIKKQYKDAILFFRMGDFYEMFFEDAKIAAPVLEIVLTTRDKKKENSVPLCGLPYHARNYYASKLIKKGFKVAICEQMEDPSQAKSIVKREVTHILTPGSAIEFDEGDIINNYIISIFKRENSIAVASVDLAVADFEIRHFDRDNLDSFYNEIYRKYPKEIICPESFKTELKSILKRFPDLAGILINTYEDYEYNVHECSEIIKEQFKVDSLEGLGLSKYGSAISSAGVLLKYLKSLRKSVLLNITSLNFIPTEDFLILDSVSLKNLEILKNLQTQGSKGSLFYTIDFTITPMGKRLLNKWLSYPSKDIDEIQTRHNGVEEFYTNLINRTEIRALLREFSDLARINSRISLNIAMPSHLLKLEETLGQIPHLKKVIFGFESEISCRVHKELDSLEEVKEKIKTAIDENPADSLKNGRFIKQGYNRELDELRSITKNAKEIISSLEASEKKATGIPSLKIKYNRVFGYFIEVTKTHLKLIPEHYIRKQTLVSSERFITDELKKLESKILTAEEKIIVIEKRLYAEVIEYLQKFSEQLNHNSGLIALIDVISAGAELAHKHRYTRPEMNRGLKIEIQDGRHPIVEYTIEKGFIPNDSILSSDGNQIMLITGPNMGGKSTYLRQNALIVILAQIGYFVPAKRARIGLCDRIFTRIGASDSLIEGKSTFLVEMIEAALILNNATKRSLILLDEIGRGTSTYDGISIAWAVIEYLHGLKFKPKTLFATHYHELTELSKILKRVVNYHITVKEWDDRVIFLHKIAPGATDQSFGIHVAKIAGIPQTVVDRAKSILNNLEQKEISRVVKERLILKKTEEKKQSDVPEISKAELGYLDEVKNELLKVDISNITPLQALNILHYLKSKTDELKN
jgi:DNA mismatch repair protein MutS